MYGSVYLIGCGPGDAELLSVKAVKSFQKLQVALIDNLVSEEIVDLLPAFTLKIRTAKSKGKHSFSQDRINEMLFKYAKDGLCVGRLKAGDPFVFGRGAEESLYLQQRGVGVEIIPGISSALSAPLCGGIPLSARGISSAFSVVTAHLKDGEANFDWIELLKLKNHTLVVLMGLSQAEEISKKAIESGVCADTPVAIIQSASTAHQRTVITNLKKLPKAAKSALSPSVIVIGECVRLSSKLPHYLHSSAVEEVLLEHAC